MRPCGKGLRETAAGTIRCSRMPLVYVTVPMSSDGSSRRFMSLPTHACPFVVVVIVGFLLLSIIKQQCLTVLRRHPCSSYWLQLSPLRFCDDSRCSGRYVPTTRGA